MTLKAVLFDFNGVIINDEPIHEQLLNQLLIEENLCPAPGEFREICLGRSDRSCLTNLLIRRGRVVSEDYLNTLLERKAQAYQQTLSTLDPLPIYPTVPDLIAQIHQAHLPMAIVSGARRREVEWILQQTSLEEYFSVIVTGDDVTQGKPEPDSYLLAITLLNQQHPSLNLHPDECLAIEDTFAGIEAAKAAGIPVVGVAHIYPLHMLQRLANWCIDYLSDLELERVQAVYAGTTI